MRAFAERCAIFALILVAAYTFGTGPESSAAQVAFLGGPAPNVLAVADDGSPVSVADARGHPVWLTFFSSWCTYCRAENPEIEAIYQEQRGGAGDLLILGVGVGETQTSAAEYARAAGLSFPIAADVGEAVARQYSVVAIPTHIFIDRSGVIREIKIGTLQAETMRRSIAAIAEGGR